MHEECLAINADPLPTHPARNTPQETCALVLCKTTLSPSAALKRGLPDVAEGKSGESQVVFVAHAVCRIVSARDEEGMGEGGG